MARLFLLKSLLEEAKEIDNSSSRRQATKIRNLPLLVQNDNFVEAYRLPEELIHQLETDLQNIIKPTRRRGKGLSTRIKILSTLSFLASGSYQKVLKQNICTYLSQPSVSRCLNEVVNALNHPSIVKKYIRFPQNQQERLVLKERFYEKFKIPTVIGCIDGTFVAMVRPSENEERYYCRKGYHARNIQLITDADLNILHVDPTYGGATHDSFIFDNCEIKRHLEVLTNAGEQVTLLGNPRNKCALQPGHSLMDWIRLGNSGKDLTGVGGRTRPVSTTELATHNTKEDAWLAIRGRVYNITHYLPFHPGGVEELMRGAGIDATQLFDKVHPWVNYDQLLAKCLVGPLSNEVPDAEELFGTKSLLREPSKAQELVRKSMENLANCITPVRKKINAKSEENVKSGNPSKIMQSLIQSSDLPVSIYRRAGSSPSKVLGDEAPPPLRFDWIQTSAKLTVSVYTGQLANPGGCARLTEGMLLIEIATSGWVRTLKLNPEAKLQGPLQLRVFAESGKVEVTALKLVPSVWKGCGEATCSTASHVTAPRSVECTVRAVMRVSHDTSLLVLVPQAGPVVVPLGHHVRVHCRVNGSECVRSYTPVGEGWGGDSPTPALKLAIKRYPEGALSPVVTSLKVDDVITVSGSYGSFQLQLLKNVTTIFFIAAGTGITPMLSLLRFMLARNNPRCEKIYLLFFNKKEKDILFRSYLEDIAKEDNRLSTTHVLSDADAGWAGPIGRINTALLTDIIGKKTFKCNESCQHFACLCGPANFTSNASEIIRNLGMNEGCVHAFMG